MAMLAMLSILRSAAARSVVFATCCMNTQVMAQASLPARTADSDAVGGFHRAINKRKDDS
jgi:hypothetical protein